MEKTVKRLLKKVTTGDYFAAIKYFTLLQFENNVTFSEKTASTLNEQLKQNRLLDYLLYSSAKGYRLYKHSALGKIEQTEIEV